MWQEGLIVKNSNGEKEVNVERLKEIIIEGGFNHFASYAARLKRSARVTAEKRKKKGLKVEHNVEKNAKARAANAATEETADEEPEYADTPYGRAAKKACRRQSKARTMVDPPDGAQWGRPGPFPLTEEERTFFWGPPRYSLAPLVLTIIA